MATKSKQKKSKKKSHGLWLCMLIAVVMMLLSYLALNSPKPSEGENSTLRNFENRFGKLGATEKETVTDYLLINTSYDKVLIDKLDEDGFPVGSEPVTDRKKLLSFLQSASEVDNYKMILIDLDLSIPCDSTTDSLLVETIVKMKRIYVSRPVDAKGNIIPLISKRLDSIAGVAAYAKTNKESNFTRLPLTIGEKKSVPLLMAENTEAKSFENHGFYYTYGSKLCNKTVFAYQFIKSANQSSSNGSTIKRHNYENLGADALEGDIPLMIEDRIVVIGDLENDLHETYRGETSGSVVLLNAYYSILQGRHIVKWWLLLLEFILFSVTGYCIKNDITLGKILPFLQRAPKWVTFLLSFIGYSLVFTAIKILLYSAFNTDFFIILPIAIFTLWSTIHKHFKS